MQFDAFIYVLIPFHLHQNAFLIFSQMRQGSAISFNFTIVLEKIIEFWSHLRLQFRRVLPTRVTLSSEVTESSSSCRSSLIVRLDLIRLHDYLCRRLRCRFKAVAHWGASNSPLCTCILWLDHKWSNNRAAGLAITIYYRDPSDFIGTLRRNGRGYSGVRHLPPYEFSTLCTRAHHQDKFARFSACIVSVYSNRKRWNYKYHDVHLRILAVTIKTYGWDIKYVILLITLCDLIFQTYIDR